MTLTHTSTKLVCAALASATTLALLVGLWSLAERAEVNAQLLAAVSQPTTNPVLNTAVATGEVLIGMATQNASTVLL